MTVSEKPTQHTGHSGGSDRSDRAAHSLQGDRPMPPFDADERTSLASWLDFYRRTLALKCAGLTEEQLREASAPPSPLTLLGLVRHMAEVERNWFRRVLLREDVPFLFGSGAEGPDAGGSTAEAGFALDERADWAGALAAWQAEQEHARSVCATLDLEHTSPCMGGQVTLRWIHTHMIAEYARHCGHADLIRERIDGRTGV